MIGLLLKVLFFVLDEFFKFGDILHNEVLHFPILGGFAKMLFLLRIGEEIWRARGKGFLNMIGKGDFWLRRTGFLVWEIFSRKRGSFTGFLGDLILNV